MTRQQMRDERRGRDTVQWRLWAAILVPPLVWAAQFNAAYFLVSVECEAGIAGFNIWLFAVSLVALVLTVATGLMALSAWRASRDPVREGRLGEVTGRSGAMALLGVALSAVFAFAIVLTGATQIVVPTC